MRLVTLGVRVHSRHLTRKTVPPEGRFHRRPRRTDSVIREIGLEMITSQTDERKGKEVLFLDPKASRCIRQLSKSPSNTKRNIA